MLDERLVCKIEYYKFVALGHQSSAYDELLERFQANDVEARDFLRLAFSKSPTNVSVFTRFDSQDGQYKIEAKMPSVLSQEELDILQVTNPYLFQRISSVYINFLKDKGQL